MGDEITIQKGFSRELRKEAAILYDAAFGTKLSVAIPDPESRVRILQEGFHPEFSFVAFKDGRMVGIAGFQTGQGSLTDGISFELLKKELGYLKSIRAVLVLSLFLRQQSPAQLLMDGISVAPEMRGSGVGTKLLHRLIEYARIEQYAAIRLDVIHTNPAARRLYERVGFEAVKTEQFKELSWLLGFEGTTEMRYNLASCKPM